MNSLCLPNSAPANALAVPAIRSKPTRHRKVLLVSYTFPPVGGAGVQRVAKFVKYLAQQGWNASVLTVANPSVPLQDASLLADIPPKTRVRKAATWEPDYALKAKLAAGGESATQQSAGVGRWVKHVGRQLVNLVLQPDVQVLWLPGAVRAGYRWLREEPHEAIVASGPPFSTFLIGAALSRRSGLPLVLDYRDEWSISNAYLENRQAGALVGRFQSRLQQFAVRSAQALIATTQASATALEEVCRATGSKAQVRCIYNGFDPADFAGEPASVQRAGASFRLAYVGTLWNLTTAGPLVAAVKRLASHRPDLAARLELFFAGRRTPAQQMLLDELRALPCQLIEHAYTDHRRVVEWLCSADALCLLLADLPGAARVVPAKLFEYFATRRPILAIAPRGEVWDLLQDYPAGEAFAPDNTAGIAEWLARRLEAKVPQSEPCWDGWREDQYSRPHQAQQLASLLDNVCANYTDAARGRTYKTR